MESLLLDGDCDVQDLVGGDEAGHAMPHRCEGQDAGGRAVGRRLTMVTWCSDFFQSPEINMRSISLLTYRRCRIPARTGGRSVG